MLARQAYRAVPTLCRTQPIIEASAAVQQVRRMTLTPMVSQDMLSFGGGINQDGAGIGGEYQRNDRPSGFNDRRADFGERRGGMSRGRHRGINRIELMGGVASEPAIRETRFGKPYARFALVTNRVFEGADAIERQTGDLHNVYCFAPYIVSMIERRQIQKGTQLFVVGRLMYRKIEPEDGGKAAKFASIITEIVHIAGDRNRETEGESRYDDAGGHSYTASSVDSHLGDDDVGDFDRPSSGQRYAETVSFDSPSSRGVPY